MKTKNIYADRSSALARLTKNNVIGQNDLGAGVIILKHSVPIGIKLWGAIDYLINYGGRTGWTREAKK